MASTTMTITPQTDGWIDEDISATADIDAGKFRHRQPIHIELFGAAVTVTALTKKAHMLSGFTSGVLVAFEAYVDTVADDGSRTVDVDLEKWTGAAWATVLTAAIQFTSGDTDLVIKAATLSDTAIANTDLYRVVVTVAGGSGNQAIGLSCAIAIDHKP